MRSSQYKENDKISHLKKTQKNLLQKRIEHNNIENYEILNHNRSIYMESCE